MTSLAPTLRGWSGAAYGCAVIAALAVAYYVAHIPIQVSDSLGNMIEIQEGGYWDLFVNQFYARYYLRPLLWVQIKLAYDLAQGHYWLMFKGIHLAQLVVTAVLFVRLARVRDRDGFAALMLGLVVLFGLHTFNGTVRQAFPINTFLTIVICVLAGMNLSISAPRLRNDLLALALCVFAMLTVESGLLVPTAIIAGWLAGFRGVSTRGTAATFALIAGYFVLRFGYLSVGMPSLIERPSGYGFALLEPPELMARFGENPYPFYAYNVLSSLATVLFSEPRNGVWQMLRAVSGGDELAYGLRLDLGTSLAATGLALSLLVRAVRRWWQGQVEFGDRLALASALVLAGNAAISFPYAKDPVMSVGGVCFALIVCVAVYDLVRAFAAWPETPRLIGSLALGVVAVAWTVRATALPIILRQEAFTVRNDWVTVYPWLTDQRVTLVTDENRALVEQLRREALARPLPHPNIDRSDYIDYLNVE